MAQKTDTGNSRTFPLDNRKASLGLPLALGSLVLGYLLGIPAIVLGIQGLGYARRHPKAGGRALSLFNIWTGGICSLAYFALTIFLLTR